MPVVKRKSVKVVARKPTPMRSVKRPSQTPDLIGRLWNQSRVLIDGIIQRPEVAIVFAMAAFLAIDYLTTTDKTATALYDVLEYLKKFKFTASIVQLMEKHQELTLASVFYVGFYLASPLQNRLIVIPAAALGILTFNSLIENFLIGLAVYAFLKVRDREVRTLAVVLALAYGIFAVSSNKDIPKVIKHATSTNTPRG